MFHYVLNTNLTLLVNEVWINKEPISLIRMKNQQKIKPLLNGKYEAMDKNVNAYVDTKSKPWNTLNYWV